MNDSSHYAALGQVIDACFSNGTTASWVEGWIEALERDYGLRRDGAMQVWLSKVAAAMKAVELIPLPGEGKAIDSLIESEVMNGCTPIQQGS